MYVSLFFLIVALSRVSLRLISEISIDQELLFRYCCQYIISPAFMGITSARVETISLWQHRQKQGTNEEANCVKPSERAKRWCATRRQGEKREGEKSTQRTTPQLRDKLRDGLLGAFFSLAFLSWFSLVAGQHAISFARFPSFTPSVC